MKQKQGKIFEKIRRIVAQIPKSKVATYGQVAKLAGINDARVVGWALWGNQDPKIPCHRVVKAGGVLATNYSLGGWLEQKERLRKEGVFINKARVDLRKCLWCSSTGG